MDDSIKKTILNKRETMKGYLEPIPPADQNAGLPQPPLHKMMSYLKVIDLPTDYRTYLKNNDLFEVMNGRVSTRTYAPQPMSLKALSWLLWATQGERKVLGKRNLASMRTVPSAGARHALEAYLFVDRVEGLQKGLYHYIADGHKLGLLDARDSLAADMVSAFGGQAFIAGSAVFFVWTVTPYRMEWRYAAMAQKYALLDAGHVCQNLYLAAASVGCGVCAVGSYFQQEADKLLSLGGVASDDPAYEFVLYAAGVGMVD